MRGYRVGRWDASTALRGHGGSPYRRTKKVWIASSQELLAMTEYRVGRWAPSTSLRAQRSNPYRRTKKVLIASSRELLAMTTRQTFAIPRRNAPELCKNLRPFRAWGMPGADAPAAARLV